MYKWLFSSLFNNNQVIRLTKFLIILYRFEKLPESVCDIANLEILIANDNKMASIDVSALSRLKMLAHLDISNNNISYIPPELGNMKGLR